MRCVLLAHEAETNVERSTKNAIRPTQIKIEVDSYDMLHTNPKQMLRDQHKIPVTQLKKLKSIRRVSLISHEAKTNVEKPTQNTSRSTQKLKSVRRERFLAHETETNAEKPTQNVSRPTQKLSTQTRSQNSWIYPTATTLPTLTIHPPTS